MYIYLFDIHCIDLIEKNEISHKQIFVNSFECFSKDLPGKERILYCFPFLLSAPDT